MTAVPLSLVLVACLSTTQIIGWATMFSAPAIIGRSIAIDLGTSLAFGLAGSSFFLVALALASRLMSRLYLRFGAGMILVYGSVGASLALALLAVVQTAWQYAACFLVLGVAGAAALSTSANTLLAEHAGKNAKRLIIAVMLGSGLSSSIGLPIMATLDWHLGWRGAVLVFALANLFVCLPLHVLAMRLVEARRLLSPSAEKAPEIDQPSGQQRALMRLLIVAVSAIGFVTWGFAVVIVEFLRSHGLDDGTAIWLAALIGAVQVGARLLEFLFAPNVQATRSAILAAALFPFAFLSLIVLQGLPGAGLFVVLFGAASGIMSVARATLPLELFDPHLYGAMTSRLALPMNLAFAAAPFVFGAVLESNGPIATSGLAVLAALIALIALIALRRAANSGSGSAAFVRHRSEPA